MMYLIIGRTGSGKTHLADLLTEKGLQKVRSRTTRTPRFEGESDYIFVTDSEADAEEHRLTETVIDGARYYTTPSDLSGKDFYVIDPIGAKRLAEAMPQETFVVLYVAADREKRSERFAMRKGGGTKEQFDVRDASETEQFDEFEHQLFESNDMSALDLPDNVRGARVFYNDYDPRHAETKASIVADYVRSVTRLSRLVVEATEKDIMRRDDEGRVLTRGASEEDVWRNPQDVAIMLLSDQNAFADFMRAVLIRSDLLSVLDGDVDA